MNSIIFMDTTMTEQNTLSPSQLDRAPFFILAALVFLLPFFFIPSVLVAPIAAKGFLLFVAVAVCIVIWILSILRVGKLQLPRTWLLPALGGLALIYLAASLFSGSIATSLIGEGFMVDTFMGVFAGLLLMLLVPTVTRSKRDAVVLYAAAVAGFVVVALVQLIRLFVGPEVLTLSVLFTPVANLVGKWNDLGIFSGLVLLLSVLTLEMLPVSKTVRILLYVVSVLALFFLILVQFIPAWYVVGIFALLLTLYKLSIRTGVSPQGTIGKAGIPVLPVLVIAAAVIFIVASGSLGGVLADYFNTGQVEVRPSWEATWGVAASVLQESPALGIGPNRFSEAWFLHKPEGVNTTAFWSVAFNLGVSFVSTALVSVGMLGFIGWLVFFVLLLILGGRSIFKAAHDTVSQYLMVSSLLLSWYLWVFLIIYTPSITIFALAFVFTGLFLAALWREEVIGTWDFSFSDNPMHNFVGALVAIVMLIVVGTSGYATTIRFIGGVLHQQGIVHAQAGDIDAAQRSVMRALSFSEQAIFYRTLAEVETVQLGSLLQRSDIGPDALRNQFQTLLASAIGNAQRATAVERDDYRNWMILGRIYEELVPAGVEGAYENALATYEQALAYNPKGPDIFLALARLEARHGDNDAARSRIGEALSVKGNYTDAIFLLSQIEIAEGNVSQAIRSVEATTTIEPNNPVVFFQLGLLRYSADDFAGAASAFETAVILNPVYANARYFLGLSYDRLGRRGDAIVEFEEVQRLNPDNQEVAFILNNLHSDREPFADVQPPLDDEPELRSELPADEPVVEAAEPEE